MSAVHSMSVQSVDGVGAGHAAVHVTPEQFVALCKGCTPEQVQAFIQYKTCVLQALYVAPSGVVSNVDSSVCSDVSRLSSLGVVDSGDVGRVVVGSGSGSVSAVSVVDGVGQSADPPVLFDGFKRHPSFGEGSTSSGASVGSWRPSRRVKDGFCYSKLFSRDHYKSAVRRLGSWPTIKSLLCYPFHEFEDLDVLDKFTVRPSLTDRFHVSAGGLGARILPELSKLAFLTEFEHGTFGDHLKEFVLPTDDDFSGLNLSSRLGGSGTVCDVDSGGEGSVERGEQTLGDISTAGCEVRCDSVPVVVSTSGASSGADGFCYLHLILSEYGDEVSHQLGRYPTFDDILSVSADKFLGLDDLCNVFVDRKSPTGYHLSNRGVPVLPELQKVASRNGFPVGSFGWYLRRDLVTTVKSSFSIGLLSTLGGDQKSSDADSTVLEGSRDFNALPDVISHWSESIMAQLARIHSVVQSPSDFEHVHDMMLKFMNNGLQHTFRLYDIGSPVFEGFDSARVDVLLERFYRFAADVNSGAYPVGSFGVHNFLCQEMMTLFSNTRRYESQSNL